MKKPYHKKNRGYTSSPIASSDIIALKKEASEKLKEREEIICHIKHLKIQNFKSRYAENHNRLAYGFRFIWKFFLGPLERTLFLTLLYLILLYVLSFYIPIVEDYAVEFVIGYPLMALLLCLVQNGRMRN